MDTRSTGTEGMTKSFSINACIDSCDRLLAKSAQRSATTLLILCALWATFDVPSELLLYRSFSQIVSLTVSLILLQIIELRQASQ